MKFIKNNLKVIIGFIIGVILASSITVYAYSYLASDISYTRDGTNIKSVEEALNELYRNKKETSDDTKSITANGEQELDKYYKKLNVNVYTNDDLTYVGYYESETYKTAQVSTLTINNVEPGKYLIAGGRTKTGTDQLAAIDLTYDFTSVTGGTYESLSNGIGILTVSETSNVVLTYPAVGVGTVYYGRLYAYLFKY